MKKGNPKENVGAKKSIYWKELGPLNPSQYSYQAI